MTKAYKNHDQVMRNSTAQSLDSHEMVMRIYTTLLWLLSLTAMSVLVCSLDVLMNSVFIISVLINSVLIN